jgi:hypothetical protein
MFQLPMTLKKSLLDGTFFIVFFGSQRSQGSFINLDRWLEKSAITCTAANDKSLLF